MSGDVPFSPVFYAFRPNEDGQPQPPASAMALRDWFAGQAIMGILANPDISAAAFRGSVSTEDFRTDTSRAAYQVADALLAARSKP